MDELAYKLDLDPIELRLRNEPDVDPEKNVPFLDPLPGRLPAERRRDLRLGAPAPRARARSRTASG
jgi:CO/xanthine dehydrogenase Mo-binding subunit